MEQRWETCWQRACKDTEHFRKSGWSFWALEVVGAAVFGVVGAFVGYWLTPSTSNALWQFAYRTIGGGIGVVVGFIGVFILIFGWNLYRASYRQRDEARKKVEKLQDTLGQVGYIEAVMKEGTDFRNEFTNLEPALFSDFKRNQFQYWYEDISEYFQRHMPQEYPNWHHDVYIAKTKPNLEEVLRALELGYDILKDIQKRLTS